MRVSRKRHSTYHHRGSGTSQQAHPLRNSLLDDKSRPPRHFFSMICGRGTSTIARRSAVALVHRVLSLWWSNHLDLIVEGANAVSSFFVRSLSLGTWSCHQRSRHRRTTLRVSTSHFIWKEVSLVPAHSPLKCGWSNTSAERIHSARQ